MTLFASEPRVVWTVQCIDEFEVSHGKVVDWLRRLKDNSDRYRIDAACGSDESQSDATSSVRVDAATNCAADDSVAVGTMTEEELKEKHDKVYTWSSPCMA